MPTADELVQKALEQEGDEYGFGHEVDLSDPNPDMFDCSELPEWLCAQLRVKPIFPDGTIWQIRHCRNHGTLISVEEAIGTRGALLYLFRNRFGEMVNPFKGERPAMAHVAISLGDNRTIEARGRKYGVGIFSAFHRGWTHAAKVPGLEYEE